MLARTSRVTTAPADHGILADVDTLEDDDVGANPDVVVDPHRLTWRIRVMPARGRDMVQVAVDQKRPLPTKQRSPMRISRLATTDALLLMRVPEPMWMRESGVRTCSRISPSPTRGAGP